MLNSNKALGIVIAALLLTSCKPDQSAKADIIDVNSIEASDLNYKTVMCEVGEVTKPAVTQGYLHFPIVTPIYFDGESPARLMSVNAVRNQFVKKGEILAELAYDNVQLAADVEKLRLQIEDNRTGMLRESQNLQAGIDRLTADLGNMQSDGDLEQARIQRLLIEKARCEYDYYLYSTQRKITLLERQMKDLTDDLAGHVILAPYDGYIANVSIYVFGELLQPGSPILVMYDRTKYQLRITSNDPNFRYNNAVEVDIVNDGTYTGRVVSDPTAGTTNKNQLSYCIELDYPEDKLDLERMANRGITVRGTVFELFNVPYLPMSVVKNEDNKRYVFVLEDNIPKKRYVQVGLNNFTDAEIISGVKPGELVLE